VLTSSHSHFELRDHRQFWQLHYCLYVYTIKDLHAVLWKDFDFPKISFKVAET